MSVTSLAPWILPTIGAFLFSGLAAFVSKVSAARKIDSALLNVYVFLGLLVFSSATWFFLGTHSFGLVGILSASINAGLVYWNHKCRVDALAHMDSSVFFMNYRVGSSLLLAVAGVWIFGEHITLSNVFGIFLGFFVFYFLLERTADKKGDFSKGAPYLAVSTMAIVVLNVIIKAFLRQGGNVYDYLFVASIAGAILSIGLSWNKIRSAPLLHNPGNIIGIGLLQGALLAGLTIATGTAYAVGGDMVIVYKIVSYSLFVPIVFSLLFYGEKLTRRKLIAVGIMVVSLYFLA